MKRLLDNSKYIGQDEFPPIIKERDFQLVHQMEYGYVMLAEMEVAEGVFKLRRICEQV